jgi:ABC-type glycerol-3-phosphate transport system permease component
MKRKQQIQEGVVTIFASLLLFITFYPFFMLLCGSLKDKMQLVNHPWFFTSPMHFHNYQIAASQIIRPLFNSFIVTGAGILLTLLFSALAAYAIAHSNVPGKKFFYFYIISLLMVPGFVILIPQFLVVRDMHLYNTYLGQILPPTANNVAMGVMLMTTFFGAIPNSIVESAKVEGCGPLQMFTKMILPLSKPIMATVSITTGLNLWNNYMWPLIITTGKEVTPVIVAITRLTASISEGNGPLFAAYVIAAVPILILFAFASRQFISGLTAGAVKG